MTGISRRMAIGGGAAFASMWTGSAGAWETPQTPAFGPDPAPLAGADLPSFRYALGEEQAKQFDGGWAKEATVVQFPVSETLAGVLMQLDPGALRELHWHANAAEWAYVLDGRCRVTTIDPDNRSETVDFGPGDVWYFPRGHGHSIQGIANKPCLFLLVFDNGYFSEFGTFSISDWVGHAPAEVLAKNFGVSAEVFANFPKKEVYISKGPVPAPLPADPPPGSMLSSALTHRYRFHAQQPDVFAGGTMTTVSMNEFPLSTTMTGAILRIKPGAIRELHWHPNASEWQYYLKGKARMTVFGSGGRARTDDFAPGDVGYVPQGYGHYIENTGGDEMEVLLVLNSGVYQSISITAWMAANTPELLGTNFKVDAQVFDDFPKGPVIMPR